MRARASQEPLPRKSVGRSSPRRVVVSSDAVGTIILHQGRLLQAAALCKATSSYIEVKILNNKTLGVLPLTVLS